MKKTLVFGLSFLCLLAAAQNRRPPLFDNVQAYPMFSGGIPFLSQDASPLPAGTWNWGVQSLWWNAFRYDFAFDSPHTTFVDSEGLLTSLRAEYALAPGWSVNLRLEFTGYFPGVMDGPLQDFHLFFHLPNQGRELFQQNTVRIFHQQGSVQIVDARSIPFSLSMVFVGTRTELLRFDGHTIALQFGMKPPLPWAFLLGSQWGMNAGLSWNHGLEDLGLFWGAGLGLAWMEADFLPEGQEWNLLWQAGLHAGWRWTPEWTLLVQLDMQGSPYAGTPSMASGRAGNLILGAVWEATPGYYVQFGMQEEGITWATNEVGFFLQIAASLPPSP